MLNLSDAIKNLYKESGTVKELELYFPTINLTIGKSNIVAESFELTEGICSEENLIFGLSEASRVRIVLYDIPQDLSGLTFTATHFIDSESVALGTYKVDKCGKQDDAKNKEVIAYDESMSKINTDVSSWYNGLFPTGTETYTLAQFRSSFLTYVGLTEDTSKLPLPNDSMIVTKTIEPQELPGRDVIETIEEINGVFGHINRDGEFTHIILKPMHHDYPQGDYPGTDYPVNEPYDDYVEQTDYSKIRFEEYRVLPIDKLQIRQEENDVGCIYGTGTNAYTIQGNFLVYGKSAVELDVIAANAATNIFDRGYRPYTAEVIGLPYIEVGDFVKYNADDTTAGYIFSRTLTGIQALQDEFSASGSEEQVQTFGLNKEIIQIKGKAAILKKTVEEVSASVIDLDLDLTGQINVLAGQVVLKVDTAGNIGYIALDGDPDTDLTSIVLKANNISLEGLITANGNFKVLLDGSIEAVNGKFSGAITGGTINIGSGNFTVDTYGVLRSASGDYTVKIQDGKIYTNYGTMYKTYFDGESIEIGYGADFGIPKTTMKRGYIYITDGYTMGGEDVELDVINGIYQIKGNNIIHAGNIGDNAITPTNKDSYTYPPADHATMHDSRYSQLGHTHDYVTLDAMTAALGILNTNLRNWVTANFQPL